MVLGFGFY